VLGLAVLLLPIVAVGAMKSRDPVGRPLFITLAMTVFAAVVTYEVYAPLMSPFAFYFLLLPQVTVFSSTIVSTVTTHRPIGRAGARLRVRDTIFAALAGHLIGLAIRAVLPDVADVGVAAPAFYAACGAVWACAR
jgi:hypothetical protein